MTKTNMANKTSMVVKPNVTKTVTPKTLGYARVSSLGQQLDGNSLDIQTKELLAKGCSEVFSDTYTGKEINRPNLNKLIERLNPGDTLMVTKLDRLSRSTVGGVELVEQLLDKGINVHVLNIGLIDDSSMGRLIMTIMLAFAQHERETIVERLKSGREYAKKNKDGYREGRKPLEAKDSEEVLGLLHNGHITATKAAQMMGVSRATFYKMRADGRLA